VAEVNKTSNIIVTPETRKMGRSVTDIRFKISKNPQLSIIDLDDGEGVRNEPVYERLRAQGVSDRLARQWINQHGAAHVAEKITYVDTRQDVRNPVSYLTAALRDDYSAADGAGQGAGQGGTPSPRAQQLTRLRDLVASRTPTQRDADKRLFMARIDDPAARLDFENHGWMSALNAAAIVAFWDDLMPGALDGSAS
jgi:hypothetical protein